MYLNSTCKGVTLIAMLNKNLRGGHSNISVVHISVKRFSKHSLIEICPFEQKHLTSFFCFFAPDFTP